ncbi:MAG: DUF3332 family protein [Ignavibacteriales bacterium]|nr:DUF3332 family protein [Ignavibacteriales bacterium]
MKRSFVNIVSSMLIAVLLTTAFGCYGSFPLINKVYKFNGGLGNKFVNELGFLVMNIVPVYGVAAFIDAVLLNTIEFWSGRNPVSASNDAVVPLDPTSTLTLRGADGSVLLTTMTDEGISQYVFQKGTDGTVVRDVSGKVLARCTMTQDGGMRIYDGNSNLVADCSAAQVQHLGDASKSSK